MIICKLNLKANQALDSGDYDGFTKLSRELGNQRKLANFAASQRKRDQKNADFVDSVGEIVAYCEKYGGAIPKLEIKEPVDIIDTIINDLKEYNKTLIYQDTALANQVEDYLKKREILEQQKKDKELAKSQGFDEYQLTDDDLADYEEAQRQLKEQDAQTLLDIDEEEE